MTLLPTAVALLVLVQAGYNAGIELDTAFTEYHQSYFGGEQQARGYVNVYRNAFEEAKRRNRGPLVVGRHRRKKSKKNQVSQTSLIPGSNGAASNNGGIIKWENITARFAWRRKRQTVGKFSSHLTLVIPTSVI